MTTHPEEQLAGEQLAEHLRAFASWRPVEQWRHLVRSHGIAEDNITMEMMFRDRAGDTAGDVADETDVHRHHHRPPEGPVTGPQRPFWADRPPTAPPFQLARLALCLGGSEDSFTGDLLRLYAQADLDNRARLIQVYPVECLLYDWWVAASAGDVRDGEPSWAEIAAALERIRPVADMIDITKADISLYAMMARAALDRTVDQARAVRQAYEQELHAEGTGEIG